MEKRINFNKKTILDIQSLWKKQINILERIKEKESFENYFNSIDPEIREKGFQKMESAILVCIDEGCTHQAHEGPEPELNLAGSGILYSVEEAATLLKESVSNSRLSVITSHDGCGAAKLANKNPQKFSQELVDYLNNKYQSSIKHQHISGAEMTRVDELHEAVVTYYNCGNELFDATKIQDVLGQELLPKGFTIDAGFFPENNSLEELNVSLNIAFSEHGFGERFSRENPYLIVLVNPDQNQEEIIFENIKNIEGCKNGLIKIEKIKK